MLAVVLVGCSNYSQHVDGFDYRTINIDGCEYIAFSTYGGSEGVTHKGNCTNDAHVSRIQKVSLPIIISYQTNLESSDAK